MANMERFIRELSIMEMLCKCQISFHKSSYHQIKLRCHYVFIYFDILFRRFNIAIKTNRMVSSGKAFPGTNDNDLGPLLDEAKTMLDVGSYHENIVNLQGVTCLIKEDRIVEV